MQVVKGQVVSGVGDFRNRMTNFREAFFRATGEELIQGTLNVDVGKIIPPKEHFRIRGTAINEPQQDLLFEVCRANGLWAYRIRPYCLKTGGGGHGDSILEIACSKMIPNDGWVEIELFREEIESAAATV